VSIKHFTYLFTFFAFTFIVVLCLADFSFFSFIFLQLEAAMKLLQRKEEGIRLQQWSLPSGVSQGLSAARSATLGSSVLADMDAFFREFDRCHSVPVMLSISGSLMM
jgi:hypothetical protein